MKTYWFVLLLLLSGAQAFANRDEGMTPADGFFLPQGNAKAGEQIR